MEAKGETQRRRKLTAIAFCFSSVQVVGEAKFGNVLPLWQSHRQEWFG